MTSLEHRTSARGVPAVVIQLNVFVFGLLILASGAGAQDDLARIVDGLQLKYRRMTSLSADFTQVYTAQGERTRRESGHLLLKKPGKMRWDYTTPEAKLFVSDGKVIYEYVPSEKMATRTRVRETNDLRRPFMFLLGRGDLRRDFKRIEFAQEAPARAGNRVLRLFPKEAHEFRELLVEVDPSSLQLSRLTLVERDGARSDFIFGNLRENVPASDATFRFQPPAGVQVIDG